MSFIKTIFLYLLLFLLFYFETEQIGPITFSQVWKIPLFVFLVWQVLIIRKKNKPTFIKWSYARASKNLLNGGVFLNYILELLDFMRYLMFPLMFEYISIKVKSVKNLDFYLLALSQFVILSGIPFVLGILSSNSKTVYTFVDHEIFVGIFQNPHAASITTAVAILVILSFLKSKSNQIRFPKLNYLLVLVGIYLLFLTLIRTGIAMFILGIIFLYKPEKLTSKQIIRSVLLFVLIVIGFIYLLESNETFYNRIFDIRNNKETAIGSGRLVFWEVAYDLWANGNIFELFFGFGLERLTQNMELMTGMKVYAHNEFFTQLAQNGLFGIIFLLGYLWTLFKFIQRHKKKKSYSLGLSVFILYVSLMITQGGMWFQLDVYMALVYVKLYREPIPLKEINESFTLTER